MDVSPRFFRKLLSRGIPDLALARWAGGGVMSQSFTFIDPAGNQAQYTVYDADRHNEYRWSNDHGDSGVSRSYTEAQNGARNALKASMSERRRSDRVRR
jgi:hypothetical protein